MLILHRACLSPVYQKMELKLISPISLSVSGLGIIQGSLTLPEKLEFKIFCPTCNTDVEIGDLCGKCYQCGDILNLGNLFLSEELGGIYCKNCKPEMTFSVEKAIKKVRI